MKLKSLVSTCFFTAARIWGSAWLALLASLIPLYIWRGTNDASPEKALFVENLILSACGLLFGFVILTLLQSKDDSSERLNGRQSILTACCSTGFYIAVWLIAYLFNHNNIWIAVSGCFLGRIFGVNAENLPTFTASLLSALIFGTVYTCAILLGTKRANRRRRNFLKELKK